MSETSKRRVRLLVRGRPALVDCRDGVDGYMEIRYGTGALWLWGNDLPIARAVAKELLRWADAVERGAKGGKR